MADDLRRKLGVIKLIVKIKIRFYIFRTSIVTLDIKAGVVLNVL
jgi:hypothetical protein